MAAVRNEGNTSGGVIVRLLIGLALTGLCVMEAAQGRDRSILAGIAGAAAIYLLRPTHDLPRQAAASAIDFIVITLFAYFCDPANPLWRAPETLDQIIRFSSVGAGVEGATVCVLTWRHGERFHADCPHHFHTSKQRR